MQQKLKYGMVGGGIGSFIGDVHRRAIALDGKAELVAGVFSRDKDNCEKTGQLFGLDPSRVYSSYQEMAEKEANRRDGIDFVVIVTPNNLHYSVAKEFLKNGISVSCDKPLTIEISEALELKDLAKKNNCLFVVTYTYTGHVMAKEARAIVQRGDIGQIRVITAEYPQSWLVDTIEKKGQKQALWRTDPKQSGKSNCVGDIGSHIENMVSYITGLKIKKLIANMDIFGEGRTLDNNAEIILKYNNGASGTYWCSQVAIGYDNALKVRIFGTEGAVEFIQENCNYLKFTKKGQPTCILSRGNGYISETAAKFNRLPGGHPEGFFEAFANIYSAFVDALKIKLSGGIINEEDFDYPNIDAGIDGVKFISKCVESMEKGSVWVDFD